MKYTSKLILNWEEYYFAEGGQQTVERPDIDTFTLTTWPIASGAWYNLCAVWASYDWDNLFIWRDLTTLTQHLAIDWELSNYNSSPDSTLSWYQSRWLRVNSDWTKLYNSMDNWNICEITMSTPYSLSWATVTAHSWFGNCTWISFSKDWTIMCVWIWSTPKTIKQYTLSTPFDISSCDSWTTVLIDAVQHTTWDGQYVYWTAISPTWKKMYFSADQGVIYQYNFTVPWDWSTATYYWRLDTWVNHRMAFSFSGDGKKLYTWLIFSGDLYQYDSAA